MRLCPTRADGAAALIAHTITLAQCQERQREHFHKCPTCVHHNAAAVAAPALNGHAPAVRQVEAKVG
jgi:hypothetical protein